MKNFIIRFLILFVFIVVSPILFLAAGAVIEGFGVPTSIVKFMMLIGSLSSINFVWNKMFHKVKR